MPLPRVLIDSGFLYAILDKSNPRYHEARHALLPIPALYLIPDVALTETAFLFQRTGGTPAVLKFLDAVVAAPWTFEPVDSVDLIRAREIMVAYASAKLDFVDCCIMAIAERLDTAQIFTFDRRDFGIVRPRHVDHFLISP